MGIDGGWRAPPPSCLHHRPAEGELLAPGHFITAAEETGLVVPLGEHVLIQALRHLLARNGAASMEAV